MKFVTQPAANVVDALLGNRNFQFVFWAVMSALVALVVALLLYKQMSTIELSLLNIKMRLRSEMTQFQAVPSPDIVILGLDGTTDNYIRLNPQAGYSLTLPREKLAAVVDYLTAQGVRAIILDLEFKDDKPGDAALAAALKRNGRIYAADRIDYDLNAFIRDKSTVPPDLLLYDSVFRPFANTLASTRSRFMPWKTIGPQDLGFGAFYPVYPTIVPVITQLTAIVNMGQLTLKQQMATTRELRRPKPPDAYYATLLEKGLTHLCLNNNYEASFANRPEFLRMLVEKRLRLELDAPLPEEVNRAVSMCYVFPTASPLMDALAGIGISSIDYDDDAFIRAAPILYKSYQGNFYTYLGVRPVLDLLDIRHIAYEPGLLRLDDRAIPLWENRKVLINWRNPRWLVAKLVRAHGLNPAREPGLLDKVEAVDASHNNPLLGGGHIYRQISMIDVLRRVEGHPPTPEEAARLLNLPGYPASGPFSFKNKIVVVGNTVTDIHRTPMSNNMFGPEVVASALDMALNDRVFIQKAPAALQWLLVAGLVAAIGVAIISFEHFAVGFASGLILIILYWMTNLLMFVYWGFLLDVLIPTGALGMALATSSLYRYYIHDQEKHHLANVFSKYVSPQIMSEIVKNPEKALDNLKGGKKELTVLFSDLQNFTQQFENADPELMVEQLNEYFDIMTEIILGYGGTYDKYMGDSIMAFFGAPADVPEHAEMACRAALDMEAALKTLNETWRQEDKKLLSHGIGISSGEMFVGNFGSKNIKNFTVMGSNVNLGARLETYTRVVRWPIIISARTLGLAQSRIQVRDLGQIKVKGFTDAVQIYGLEAIRPEFAAGPEAL